MLLDGGSECVLVHAAGGKFCSHLLQQAVVPFQHGDAITEITTKLYTQPVTGRIGHRSRHRAVGLGLANGVDEPVGSDDEIARITRIASLA